MTGEARRLEDRVRSIAVDYQMVVLDETDELAFGERLSRRLHSVLGELGHTRIPTPAVPPDVVVCICTAGERPREPDLRRLCRGLPTVVVEQVDVAVDMWMCDTTLVGFVPRQEWVGSAQRPERLSEGDVVNAVVGVLELMGRRGYGGGIGHRVVSVDELQIAIEAFVYEWRRSSRDIGFTLDDERTGDALAQMASEVVKAEDPPLGVLKTTFEWFLHKVDVFTEEAAKAAGKAFGAGAGAGAGIAVTGQLPKLVSAVNSVLRQLPN